MRHTGHLHYKIQRRHAYTKIMHDINIIKYSLNYFNLSGLQTSQNVVEINRNYSRKLLKLPRSLFAEKDGFVW